MNIHGQKMSSTTSSKMAAKKGRLSLVYSSTGHFKMAQEEYMAVPTGGVMPPSVTTVINTIPKCTGSTPRFLTIGRKIGVNSSVLTVPSINIPAINTNTLIIIITRYLFWLMLVINSAMDCGTLSYIMPKPIMALVMMINKITPLSPSVTLICFPQVFPLKLTVNKLTNDKGINHGKRTGLTSRKDAKSNPHD